jgi:hypothetical protein
MQIGGTVFLQKRFFFGGAARESVEKAFKKAPGISASPRT